MKARSGSRHFETMAAFMLVEHANGAMFDRRWVRRHPRTVAPNRRRTGPATATSPR
ncbi:hypothetical protein BZL30_9487 [Mycobacterium kansasii]|uniref:Uncharacterized protein n=1 Tax=Mycobacterium kansasii TaxID=1768 RepID=A0A1V3W8W5_MYCKA|nr:hypothetical protein BZL30_9487 [Mycobacterium kansasii]